jgi:lysophospholipase L1-like esterase
MNPASSGYDVRVTLRLAVLGDSIGFGQGASRSAHAPGPRLSRLLAEHDIAVRTEVFAVPGARSVDLRAQVDRALTWRPQLAVIVIGANDLAQRVRPEDAGTHLGAGVRRLREAGAEVVVAPAPDLSVVPHAPSSLRPALRRASELLRARQVEAALAAGARVADMEGTTSASFAEDRSLFSDDAFHPSSAGYVVITDALLPEVLAAAEALIDQDDPV